MKWYTITVTNNDNNTNRIKVEAYSKKGAYQTAEGLGLAPKVKCQVCGDLIHYKNGSICMKASCKEQWAEAWK